MTNPIYRELRKNLIWLSGLRDMFIDAKPSPQATPASALAAVAVLREYRHLVNLVGTLDPKEYDFAQHQVLTTETPITTHNEHGNPIPSYGLEEDAPEGMLPGNYDEEETQ